LKSLTEYRTRRTDAKQFIVAATEISRTVCDQTLAGPQIAEVEPWSSSGHPDLREQAWRAEGEDPAGISSLYAITVMRTVNLRRQS
jgi:hypothetical protein